MKNINKWSVNSGQWTATRKRSFLTTDHCQLNTGLTLVEILVVTVILALIVSVIFTLFQGGLLSYRKGTDRALIHANARAVLDLMSREIEQAMTDERRNIHCRGCNGPTVKTTNGKATTDEFFFIAPLCRTSGKVDICEVGYWLKDDNMLMRHYITEDANAYDFEFHDESGDSPNDNSDEVIGNISDLQFEYFDGSNWANTWGPSYTLPSAVKITLTLEFPLERGEVRQDSFISIVYIPGSGR